MSDKKKEPFEVYPLGGGRWTLVRPKGSGFEHLGVFESPDEARKFAKGAGEEVKKEDK